MNLKYRPEIDGLRTLALLPVLFFHAGFNYFSGGFVGVDIFFVISGYLITSIIVREMQIGSFSLVTFYERRARRILPALFTVMFFCLFPAWFLMLPHQLEDFGESLVSVSLYLSNIYFWQTSGYFGEATEHLPLLHTWSLSVEEQYYVFFPLMIICCWRAGLKNLGILLCLAALLSLGLSEWGWRYKATANFFLIPTRAWELFIGSIMAVGLANKTIGTNKIWLANMLSLIGITMIVYSIIAYDHETPFPSLYALTPTIGTALIIGYALPGTLVYAFLSSKIMVMVGLISYSTYLWHQPLFAFARIYSLVTPSSAVFGFLCVASLCLGYLSWRFIEKPFRDRTKFKKKQIFLLAIAGSTIFSACGLGLKYAEGFPQRLGSNFEFFVPYFEKGDKSGELCEEQVRKNPDASSACVIGKKDKHPTVAIWGDSHASALMEAFDLQLGIKNIAAKNFSYLACPPVLNLEVEQKDTSAIICEKYRLSVIDSILNSSEIDTVVLAARWTMVLRTDLFDNQEGGVEHGSHKPWKVAGKSVYNEQEIAEEIQKTIYQLLNSNKKVILVYPIPEAGWNVPQYLAKRALREPNENFPLLSTDYSLFQTRTKSSYLALDEVGNHANLKRIYPASIFCDLGVPNRCINQRSDGTPLYYDDDHLNSTGAGMLVDQILSAIENPPIE